jgi:hypothetical protein
MAFSKVQLSSNALIQLGADPIASFDEDSTEAAVASNLYDTSYLAMLSSHRWNFATKKAQLARLAATPTNEYSYQFQLPTDMVMLITTYPASTYRILGDKLYSNFDTASIDYIFKVTEDNFPAYFVKAFEFYLAMQFAIPITEDLNKRSEMEKTYEKESRKARYADSQSAPATPIIDDPYIRVRNY